MTPSAVALGLARRYPHAARLAIYGWARWYFRGSQQPHWLFSAIRLSTGSRIRKRFTLPTGQKLYADPFAHVGTRLQRHGSYEPETVRVFEAVVRKGAIVLDVGANVGPHTIVLSTLVGRRGVVHSLEPDPVVFRDLVRNVRLNRCANVTCNAIALASHNGSAILYLGRQDVGNSLQPTLLYGGRTISVTTMTLDDYVEANGLGALDVLKLDVEGAELSVLHGARSSIERFQPMIILEFSIHTQAFGYSSEDLRDLLDRWGYVLFEIDEQPLRRVRQTDGREYFNVLAVPRLQAPSLAARRVIEG